MVGWYASRQKKRYAGFDPPFPHGSTGAISTVLPLRAVAKAAGDFARPITLVFVKPGPEVDLARNLLCTLLAVSAERVVVAALGDNVCAKFAQSFNTFACVELPISEDGSNAALVRFHAITVAAFRGMTNGILVLPEDIAFVANPEHAFVKGVDVSFQLNHALRENAKDCRDVHPKYGKDEVRLDASVIWVRNTLS